MLNAFKTPARKRPSLGINVPPPESKFRRASAGDFVPVTPRSPSRVKSPSSFPIRAAHEAGWDARHLDKYNVRYDPTKTYHLSAILPERFCHVKSLG
jgi:hypothetical protein